MTRPALALLGATLPALSTGAVPGTVVGNPLELSLALAKTEVVVGERLRATTEVRNLGAGTLAGVRITIRTEPTALEARPASRLLPQLRGERTSLVSSVLCARAAGRFVVVAQAASEDPAFRAESEARVLEISGGGRRACA